MPDLVQAKDAAYEAANSAYLAAGATWAALERVTALYTSTRQYYMLDDLVEASAAAKKVCCCYIKSCNLVFSL